MNRAQLKSSLEDLENKLDSLGEVATESGLITEKQYRQFLIIADKLASLKDGIKT